MVVLDAWALVAFFKDEPSAEQIETAIIRGSAAISAVNLGEVLYISMRERGEAGALGLIDDCRRWIEVIPADWPVVAEAARIKAGGGLSYADAFCLATGRVKDAEIWTGDPEILRVASKLDCKTRDLRD